MIVIQSFCLYILLAGEPDAAHGRLLQQQDRRSARDDLWWKIVLDWSTSRTNQTQSDRWGKYSITELVPGIELEFITRSISLRTSHGIYHSEASQSNKNSAFVVKWEWGNERGFVRLARTSADKIYFQYAKTLLFIIARVRFDGIVARSRYSCAEISSCAVSRSSLSNCYEPRSRSHLRWLLTKITMCLRFRTREWSSS